MSTLGSPSVVQFWAGEAAALLAAVLLEVRDHLKINGSPDPSAQGMVSKWGWL